MTAYLRCVVAPLRETFFVAFLAMRLLPRAKMLPLFRHSGMDCRNPDCRDATKSDRPWSLGSGGPCRNDGHSDFAEKAC